MQTDLILKTEAFLKKTFTQSSYLTANPTEAAYRLEHSYRVANIAKMIAEAEGFDVTYAVIGGLLHDIAYCEEMPTWEQRKEHGRKGAAIARPFLESLGLPAAAVGDICYGIAIHVDDQSDFDWHRSPFTETVGDADNIDRFDAYRIYESLEAMHFSQMPLTEKKDLVLTTLGKLKGLKTMKLGTKTATDLWRKRLNFYIQFYKKLQSQLDNSIKVF